MRVARHLKALLSSIFPHYTLLSLQQQRPYSHAMYDTMVNFLPYSPIIIVLFFFLERGHYNLFLVVTPSSDVFELSLFTFGKLSLFTFGKWRENLNLKALLSSIFPHNTLLSLQQQQPYSHAMYDRVANFPQ